jgi:hypothetical protein
MARISTKRLTKVSPPAYWNVLLPGMNRLNFRHWVRTIGIVRSPGWGLSRGMYSDPSWWCESLVLQEEKRSSAAKNKAHSEGLFLFQSVGLNFSARWMENSNHRTARDSLLERKVYTPVPIRQFTIPLTFAYSIDAVADKTAVHSPLSTPSKHPRLCF